MKKKRNPTDATLRNVKASGKRFAALEMRVKELETIVDYIAVVFRVVPNRVKALKNVYKSKK